MRGSATLVGVVTLIFVTVMFSVIVMHQMIAYMKSVDTKNKALLSALSTLSVEDLNDLNMEGDINGLLNSFSSRD